MNIKRIFTIFVTSIYIIAILLTIATNSITVYSTRDEIHNFNKVIQDSEQNQYDAILVLGCGVVRNQPSPLLRERLDAGIELYKKGVAPKIIMSGDHGREDYDEVNVMKSYAIQQGVPSEDIFMDHAGFSTYESVYRAGNIFLAKKLVIVSQRYHLYRAIYISKLLNFEKVVGADSTTYRMYGQTVRDLREIFAREKDFFKVIFRPKPTFLGDRIDLNQSGDITND